MRRLEGPELAAYDLDPALAQRVRIVQVPILPPGASGMTIGSYVFLTSDVDRTGGRELLAHELVHVRQFAEAGTLPFLMRYLRDYVSGLVRLKNHRRAYLAIPAEVEARAEAAVWKRTRTARR